ncbi:MAG: type II toxin-antitoxin system VapC family toxin [Candidatus Xenobia bacterium]
MLLDANVLVYNAADLSLQCTRVLERGERGELRLFLSSTGHAECLHRLMIAEARHRGLLKGSNPARSLKEHPDTVKQLKDYLLVEDVLTMAGVGVLPLTREVLRKTHPLRARYGLLVNDSILVATAETHQIRSVVSADRDLMAVSEIELFRPDDLT